ncbi:Spx/MgsR family RNA polymerase-binding regulatory protein [Lactococcus formosensis]|jgi:regulatory protein spx|uniref:Spx/MgsR family RNA polymerase-binding regulatory protein n=1 Tax=Lactococcus formosensis TaxID=1281486 RepID=A0A9X4NWX0_9LACT|nr:Spx/MgsR family RNA polymerase-binding regulatory protein [Lactococcus formosensis]MCH1723001.1 Spx/MgsR family RNA polymerase-binding regulatory protein [Lactococcus formosensis]MDG6112016.1 Spx/MgsR family RNA polymerase-binding regulatory protein [Lactococcus formosensis]MDG6112726.1 Spx/MgsR family RNA polymerase-binding regulatory protein [Lactococcus formosensis]MDG6115264.1 Spx/MgsR family RNA polymerase-binding regulatory protein [Lactococcus formosensis]MDG6118216.1 Spx/MgsR family
MIKVYTVMACSSCKKAKEWLTNHELEFEEINLITDKIDPEDFLNIFSLTENGTEEIISTRSRAYKRLSLDFERLSLHELVNIIEENRTLLRRPLILDEKRLQVGYNEDDIRKFLPRSVRRVEMLEASHNIRQLDIERALEEQA